MDVRLPYPDPFASLSPRTVTGCLERALDLLFPAVCLHCGGEQDAASPWWPHLCPICTAALPRWGAGVQLGAASASPILVHPVFLHSGPTRTLVHALKYRGAVRVGGRLGRSMGDLLARVLEGPPPDTVVTGVPLHWRRRWVRGHDQVAAIVGGVRRQVPWIQPATLLNRVRATPSQVSLDPILRRQSPTAAFRLRPGAAATVRGRVVILVDDVATTGATLMAAAAELRQARPQRLLCMVAAISPRSIPTGLLASIEAPADTALSAASRRDADSDPDRRAPGTPRTRLQHPGRGALRTGAGAPGR